MRFRDARGSALAAALVVVLGALATACGGSGTPEGTPGPTTSPSASVAAECAAAVASVVRTTQAYVDSYGAPVAGAPSGGQAAPPDLREEVSAAQAQVQRLGCAPEQVARDLDRGLADVTTRGPLAEAVRDQLAATLTGRVGSAPERRRIDRGERIEDVLPTLAPGSTVVLGAGTWRFPSTLVLLQGVTVRGAGADRTRLVSTAPDVGILALTGGRVELAGLTLRHAGKRPASLLVAGPAASLVVRDSILTGASSRSRAGKAPRGGSAILMSARDTEAGDRGTTLEVTRVRLSDNAVGGIVLTGGHRVSVVDARFSGNGQCGACFLGASTGTIRDSAFAEGAVGVLVAGTARPLLVRDRFDAPRIAVQAGGRAAPVLRDLDIRSARDAGMVFRDQATGRVGGARCAGTPAGIVISGKALPYLGENSCSVVRGR